MAASNPLCQLTAREPTLAKLPADRPADAQSKVADLYRIPSHAHNANTYDQTPLSYAPWI